VAVAAVVISAYLDSRDRTGGETDPDLQCPHRVLQTEILPKHAFRDILILDLQSGTGTGKRMSRYPVNFNNQAYKQQTYRETGA
jgi:hypothetical protein